MATEKQLYWIEKLIDDPRLTPAVRAKALVVLGSPNMPCGTVLTEIFGLCPRTSAGKTYAAKASTPGSEKVWGKDFPGIVPGYYAVPSGGANDLVFFKVSFGYQFSQVASMHDRVFVKMVVGGKPDTKCSAAQARHFLGKVADPEAARKLYGQEIGQCGDCNKTLTDQESRARGIGPDCWANKH